MASKACFISCFNKTKHVIYFDCLYSVLLGVQVGDHDVVFLLK